MAALNSSIRTSVLAFLQPHHTNPVLHLGLFAPFGGYWLQVLLHSSSDVPVAGDAPATSGAGPPPEGRDWRGRK